MISDHKLLVAIFKKDEVSLSHRLQRIYIMHLQIKQKNPVQTGSATIHSRLVIQAQLLNRQSVRYPEWAYA